MSAAASTGDYSDNSLAGVDIETTTIEGKIIYTMAAKDTNEDEIQELGFYKYKGDKLAANKAFLALDEVVAAGTRGFVFTSEDNTTGIDDVRRKM